MAKPRAYVAARIPPQQQTQAALKSAHASKLKATLQKPTTTESTTYVSLFDRLAVANGVPDREARRPPSSPKAKRLEKPVARAKRKNVISPAKDKLHTPAPVVLARRQLHFEPTPRRHEAPPEALNPSQMRVLDVIQGLIAHKRQTIAALESSQS
ncbi:hypothetical protein SPRG_03594 [Saprolegnia parasitica CBS 223.65]|uniref:Uncharacterized protein n=1 Tax=Saprolegnia parasitica (strain CBS 223.65) TaxID=695850 RepID=A0A067CR39_SAPPC|nr:hypothetical protein SPRG_03594 [Saprolegnia parasitica CBS 223.65]KDO31675.1 hypothetical protein SPRG_03594 [Saprolegnia parasitica CBS 223.65]|eukprot:XP_012197563.1 hypothetical protein SPRG_03594 [Saprolegnia parasitica CBS 223.65]